MNKQAHKARVFQKIPQKHKLLVKSVICQKSQLMVTKFNHQDTLAACGFSDGMLRVYNLSTQNKISQISTNSNPKQHTPTTCLRWRPVTQNTSSAPVILTANANGNLYQFVAKTGKQIFHTIQQQNQILAMDYCPDASSFITAGKDNILRIYDEQNKKIIQELKGIKWQKSGHNNRLFAVKYKNDEKDIVISGGWDMNVNVWDRRSGQVVQTIYGPKISGDAIDIQDNLILTASNRGTEQLQLWDWRTTNLLHTYKWSQQKQDNNTFLFCAQFNKHNKQQVVACGGVEMKMFGLQGDNYREQIQVRFDEGESLYTFDSGNGQGRFLVGGKQGELVCLGGNKMIE